MGTFFLFSFHFCIIFARLKAHLKSHFEFMKKILFILALALLSTTGVQAQLFKKSIKEDTAANAVGGDGKIPVVNGKVTFEAEIPAEGLTAQQVEEKVNSWISKRYVKPTVISAKRYESEKPNTTIIKGEEYIVFKSTAFVLNRARMYYYLTLTANDGSCNFHLSRITYWYDDEDENGGIKMIAEDWITDENAFGKNGKMKKFEGRFRQKTIALKEQLIDGLTKALNE